jgi:hypothetical protein
VAREILTAEVESAIGREVFVEERHADVSLRLNEARAGSVVLALMDRRGRVLGTRQLQADSCDELTMTAALVLGLMLDFRVDEIERRFPESISGVRREPLLVSIELGLRAGAVSGYGLASALSAGISAGVAWPRSWLIEGEARYSPGARQERLGGEIQLSRLELSVRACPLVWHPTWVRAHLCGDVEASLGQARASGFDEDRSANVVGFGTGPRLVIAVLDGAFFLRGDAGLLASVRRQRFTLSDEGRERTLALTPLISASIGVGLGARF